MAPPALLALPAFLAEREVSPEATRWFQGTGILIVFLVGTILMMAVCVHLATRFTGLTPAFRRAILTVVVAMPISGFLTVVTAFFFKFPLEVVLLVSGPGAICIAVKLVYEAGVVQALTTTFVTYIINTLFWMAVFFAVCYAIGNDPFLILEQIFRDTAPTPTPAPY